MDGNTRYRTAAETAELLGITVKALRVYEHHGLIKPGRTAAGYRIYGPPQIRQLHRLLALKSLGLSLVQIGKCLAGLGNDLDSILEAQEKSLSLRITELKRVLASVAAARVPLAAGHSLSLDNLVTLIKEIGMTTGKPNWRENLAPLFAKHFSEEERARIRVSAAGAEKEAIFAERDKVLAEARALVGTDPGSREAAALARRWREHFPRFAGGDKAMLSKLRAVIDEALTDPDISKRLPFGRKEVDFLKSAVERLNAPGG